MQKDISYIVDSCLNTIKDSFEKGNLIQDLTETKTIANKDFTGNSFQLSVTCEVLQRYYDQNNDQKLLVIIDVLKEEITKNYLSCGFNYFKERAIPDDLDTASSLTVISSNPTVLENFKKTVELNSSDGLIKTWFVESDNYNSTYFHNTQIYKNKEFYHIDVLLNYLNTLNKAFNEDISSKLNNYVNTLELYNYWYIPSLYSFFLFSKLCLVTNNNSTSILLDNFVNDYLEKKDISNYSIKHKCPFDSIKKIILLENNNDNWLNNGFLVGILTNYELKTGNNLKPHIEPILKSIIKNLDNFEPSLYWSIGFSTYKSEILSRVFLLESIQSLFTKRNE